MRKKRSIRSLILWNMSLMALISLVAWNLIWLFDQYRNFQIEADSLRQEYVASQKNLIKQEVDTVISYIDNMRAQTEQRLRQSVRERVEEAMSIIAFIYNHHQPGTHGHNQHEHSPDQIKDMIRDALRPARFFDGRGYYFIIDLQGRSVLSPINPKREGTSLLNITGGQNQPVIRDMLRLGKTKGEGFRRYAWIKPGQGGRTVPKISFVKLFKPFGWLIGAGEYIDDVEKKIQQEVIDLIVNLRFGQEGYFFGSTFSGGPLFSNGKITRGSGSVWDLTDPNGAKIIQAQKRAAQKPDGGFVSYVWSKLGSTSPSPKVSYVRGISDWQWIIGTGVYLDTIDNQIALREKALWSEFRMLILKSILALVVFMGLIFAWANHHARKIGSSLTTFTDFFRQAATESTPLDSEAAYLSEFEEIAVAANKMLGQRRAAEEELVKSQRQLALAIEGSGVGLWDWQVKTGELEFNERWNQMLGYSLEDLAPVSIETWNKLVHPEDLARSGQILERHFQGQAPLYECEVRLRHRDGHWMWVLDRGKVVEWDEAGKPVRMTGTHLDITDRKLAEARIRESEDRFRTLIEHSPMGMALIDRKGRYEYFNPAFVDMFGYSEKDIVTGADWFRLAFPDPEYRHQVIRNWHEDLTASESGQARPRTFQVTGRDGDKKTTLFRLVSLSHGRQLVLYEDVTQRLKLEAQVQQTHKMEALGTLAGGIAHDFNNILTAIVGYTELALDDDQRGRPAKGQLEQVIESTTRAKDLISRILAFSRKIDSQRRPVDLNKEVGLVKKLLEPTIPRMIELDLKPADDLWSVNGDAVQISQVLMNLCANATDAMPEGGRLTIATENVKVTESDPEDQQPLQPGRYVLLTVSDTGHGMDQGTVEHIFDPFFTSKEVGRGTGLGLATVYGIVNSHQGRINCFSQVGVGTTFKIHLPAIDRIETDRKASENETGAVSGGTETILIVDDEEAIRHLSREFLVREGYRVILASNGEQALEIYHRQGQAIDLIVLDLSMPGMGGHKCLQALLEIDPEVKVIIASGYSRDQSLADITASGAAGFLAKPYSRTDILAMIREVLG